MFYRFSVHIANEPLRELTFMSTSKRYLLMKKCF
jgi:hypothetical protein